MQNDQRQAVVAIINNAGQLTMRIRRENMAGIYAALINTNPGHGFDVQKRYRRRPPENTTVNFQNLLVTPGFAGLNYEEFRAEVTRLSRLSSDLRMRNA
ncbi:hypothetical protein DL765_006651 [Monosporascus sp. GIB2]|nr:hypothetical protein DL765_006651 [Monosporascus sp. GIB2]